MIVKNFRDAFLPGQLFRPLICLSAMLKKILCVSLLCTGVCFAQSENRQQEYIRALTPMRNLAVSPVAVQAKPEPLSASATAGASQNKVKPVTSSSQEENWKPVWQPEYKSSAASIDLALQFEFNSNKVLPESLKILQDLALALNSKELAGIHFLIEGHTDGQGSGKYNQKLSQLRADQVRLTLQRLNVASSRLKSIGKGFSEPVNSKDVTAAENRRVRIISLEN